MQETKHRLHAQEIARSLDLRKYDGIICVSGDGVLVEVVNGLLRREDWETAIRVTLGIRQVINVHLLCRETGKDKVLLCPDAYMGCYSTCRTYDGTTGVFFFIPEPGYKEVGDPVEQTTSYETNGVSKVFREDRASGSNGERCDYVGPSIREADLGLEITEWSIRQFGLALFLLLAKMP